MVAEVFVTALAEIALGLTQGTTVVPVMNVTTGTLYVLLIAPLQIVLISTSYEVPGASAASVVLVKPPAPATSLYK